jgi:APA family basic amino acid/polyamine antiporter
LQGDFPSFFGKLHPRFNTPATAIVFYSVVVWLLAVTGTYLWIVALTGGASLVIYASTCAALLRLRRQQPQVNALRLPFGRVFAVAGITISLAVLTRLQFREALLMSVTALIAIANWWWAQRRGIREQQTERVPSANNSRS